MKRLLLAFLFLPTVAYAQQPQKPPMVLMPLAVVQAAAAWVRSPDATNAVNLFAALQACAQDNPINGVVSRVGPDQCPEVTQAIAERDKEIADLKAQIDAKAKEAPKP